MMKVTVRAAQQADGPVIQAVAAQSWRATYGQIYSQEYIDRFLAGAYGADALRRSIGDDRSLFLVAGDDDEQLVGFCQIGVGGDHQNCTPTLHRLYVLPTHWRQGIGGALLAVAEDWLKQRGATGYNCFVHSQNEVGKVFYLKAGFVHNPAHDHDDEWYLWKEV
jgi:GNAT superfamily N-acetyltransferase